MTSLWTFLQRHQADSIDDLSSHALGNQDSFDPHSPNLPAVTASHSCDTVENEYDDNNNHHHKRTQPTLIQIPLRHAPSTPEGLRSRPSVSLLRQELAIPSNLSWSPVANKEHRPSVLPPMPSNSWSTQGSLHSPPVSNSSFYAGDGIAQSPNLRPGRARTAVGALVVALQNVPPQRSHPSTCSLPSLPSRDLDEYEPNDVSEDSEEAFPYTPFGHTPTRHNPTLRRSSSPVSHDTSIVASPSSLTRPYSLIPAPRIVLPPNNDSPTSSRMSLMPNDPHEQPYDFEPLESSSRVVYACDQTQVSALEQESLQDRALVVEDDAAQDETNLALYNQRNQRLYQQHLLVACIERLQDQLHLVAHIETINEAGLQEVVKTSMDEEGILQGFSELDRHNIVANLNALLIEMDVAQQEEFFMSPTQVPMVAEPHNVLRDAILLCRTLVEVATPAEERCAHNQSHTPVEQQGRWKIIPGLAIAMGANVLPETPPPRGGDTSVFSLPESERTPMTSNVSTTSTITSHPQPDVHLGPALWKSGANGLQIRRTIQVLSSAFQTLSKSCRTLTAINPSAHDLARAAQTIKQVYSKQLARMDTEDLKHLIDAFELDIPPFRIARQVSRDQSEDGLPALPPLFTSRTVAGEFRLASAPQASRMERFHGPRQDDRESLFSPNTDDMRTWTLESEGEYDDDEDSLLLYDDLRRQDGSNEYNDQPEPRDAAPMSALIEPTHSQTAANFGPCCSLDEDDVCT